MSHFTSIQTQIKDPDALREACTELGLELATNAEARGYGDQRQRGDFVIRLKGPYDVALQRQPDGTFGLVADQWDGHVEKELGPNFGRFNSTRSTRPRARRAGAASPSSALSAPTVPSS